MARSKVWKYYDKLDNNTAQCQLCERIIKTCGNTSNLMKHIKTHPQINVNNDDAQVVRGMFKRHSDDFRRRIRKIPQLKQEYHHLKTKQGDRHETETDFNLKSDVATVYELEAVDTVESVTYGWADTVESPSQSPAETVIAEDIIEFEPKHENGSGLYQLHEQDDHLPQTDDEHIPLGDEDQAMVTVYQSPPSSATPQHPGKQSLLSRLAYFVCRDRHPIDVIAGEGLRYLMQTSSPFELQQWPTVVELSAYIEHQAQLQVSRFRRKMAGISTISLSCAVYDDSYLELLIHYHENRKRQTRLLSVQHLPEQFNVSQIVLHFESTCHRFDIQKSNIACMVTENNALLMKAVETFLGEHRHVPCFGHFMKTLMADIIQRPEIRDIVGKIRLKVKRKMPFVAHCPHSVYNTIDQCVRKEDDALSPAEMDLAQQLVNVIKPLFSSLRELDRNRSDIDHLASQTIPMIYTLVQELKRSSSSELKVAYDLRMFIVHQLEACFEDLERNEHTALCTLLDPRFRNIPFQSGSLVASYMTHLYGLKQGELEQHDNIVIDLEEDSTEDFNIWTAYKSHCKEKHKRNNSPQHDEDDEIASYFYDQLSDVQTKPMLLWKDLGQSHPFLNRMANRYLHIPAVAPSSKRRLDSTADGERQNDYRILGEHVENILFLSDVPFKDWL